MPSRNYQSASDYIIERILFTNVGGDIIDVKRNTVQLNIYENLNKPYLTADLMVKDDFGLYDKFGLTGVEQCDITISQPIPTGITITRSFIIQSIASTKKVNDYSEIINLKLLEKTAFDNKLLKFSKSYTGNPQTIIANILKDKLGADLDLPGILPVQSSQVKVVIPYMTPLEACKWITERASTENGMPFYFYKTLIDDNYQFKSLEEMILNGYWNTEIPFMFSQAITNYSANPADPINSYIVENYSAQNKENALDQLDAGAVGALYEIVDATSGRRETFNFNINNTFKKLYDANVFSANDVPTLNTAYTYNNTAIANYPSKHVSRMIMNNNYSSAYKNYYQEDEVARFKLDATNSAIRSLISKSSINISVPGKNFFTYVNHTIGTQINFFYHTNDISPLEKNKVSWQDTIDKRRSGKYVIYAAKHTFLDTKHSVDISAVKLGIEQ